MEEYMEQLPLQVKEERKNQVPKDTYGYRKFKDRIFQGLSFFSSIYIGIVLISIVFFISKTGFKVFHDVHVTTFFFSLKWDPMQDQYGAALFIIGTLAVTALTLLFSVPIAIILAVFISELCPTWLKSFIRAILDLLVGVPSIVYGYIGIVILLPLIRKVFHSPDGHGIFIAAIVLTVMVLPTITQISENAISSVQPSLKEASYALGSTRMQMIQKVVLPSAKQGILTATVLGMARAIGETMAVAMVIGNSQVLPKGIFSSTAVLTSNIVTQIINVDFNSTWNYALYMMALVLLLLSMALIVTIRVAKPFSLKRK